jgi:hypothetical protein
MLIVMRLGFRVRYVITDPNHRKIMDEVVSLADCNAGKVR